MKKINQSQKNKTIKNKHFITRSLGSRLAGVALVTPAALIVITLFVYPFFRSFFQSFRREGSWTLENYAVVWHFYALDIGYTIWISFVSLAILLILSIGIAGYLRLQYHRFLEFLFKIPLFVPFVVVGHAMRVLLSPHGTLNSLLAAVGLLSLEDPPSIAYSSLGIIVSLVWKNLSLSLLLILGAFQAVDDQCLEAARNYGARGFRLTKDILVPMSRASIGVAAILIFTSMMASFSIPMMIGSGEGRQMLMVDLYDAIIYRNDYGAANALGVFSYIVSLGAAFYYLRMVQVSGKKSS